MDAAGMISTWCPITGLIERPDMDRYDVLEHFCDLIKDGFCFEILKN